MKTTKITFAFIFIFTSIYLQAQLKVLPIGRVVCNNQTAIYSSTSNVADGLDIIYSNPDVPGTYDMIWGKFMTLQPNNPGLLTLQSKNGANFTVRANGNVGIFNNNPGHALEVGTAGTNYEIRVNGSVVVASDERVKKNINKIEKSIDRLRLLKSVSYNFKGVEEEDNIKNFTTNIIGGIDKSIFKPQNNKNSYGRTYYGFLAQDVQKLFPDLVYKDSAGILGIDYIGMIPLLVNALNEQEITIASQNEKIIDLETRLSKLENNNNSSAQKIGTNTTSNETNTLSYPVLDQNIPNPFNTSTTIGYYIPKETENASIYVYDMNGVQLKSYPINQKGKGSVTIQGSELIAGMYLYALIADRKVIDTKKMILTK